MPTYFKGHVRAPHKDHLKMLAERRNGGRLRAEFAAAAPPPSFDVRQLGWVGPVKDQAQCGSCWDFSGTCVVESAYYKAGVLPADGSMALSEQYTLSCGRNGGCGGDDNTTVLEWAKKTGLPTAKDYGAYAARAGRCAFQQSMTLYKIDDWGFTDGQRGYDSVSSTDSIKAAMMRYGAIGCAIAADNAFLSARPGQVFGRTTSEEIDHDVALVGWQDTSTSVTAYLAADLAAVEASGGHWILRNSWGRWCDEGYCLIGYGVNRVGTEAVWAVINASAPPIDYFV